jgi:hypothetical protein
MNIELNAQQFKEAVSLPDEKDRLVALQDFASDNKLAISPAEIIAIAQMICAVASVVCPIINNL